MPIPGVSADIEGLLGKALSLSPQDRAIFFGLLAAHLEADANEIPQWQMAEVKDALREYRENPGDVIEWDEFRTQLEAEDIAGDAAK